MLSIATVVTREKARAWAPEWFRAIVAARKDPAGALAGVSEEPLGDRRFRRDAVWLAGAAALWNPPEGLRAEREIVLAAGQEEGLALE